MRERELTICTWIHHIATVIGLITGIFNMFQKKRGVFRRMLLLLFNMTQTMATAKIVVDLVQGTCRMQRAYDNIHKLSKNEDQERGLLWSFVLLSVFVKIGGPRIIAGSGS